MMKFYNFVIFYLALTIPALISKLMINPIIEIQIILFLVIPIQLSAPLVKPNHHVLVCQQVFGLTHYV